MGMITGIGTDALPGNRIEREFAVVVHLMSAFVFALIVAHMTETFAEVRQRQERANAKLEQTKEFLDFYGVPDELSQGIVKHTAFYLHEHSPPLPHKEVYDKLTPVLREKLMKHILASTVDTTMLLEPFPTNFKESVAEP